MTDVEERRGARLGAELRAVGWQRVTPRAVSDGAVRCEAVDEYGQRWSCAAMLPEEASE